MHSLQGFLPLVYTLLVCPVEKHCNAQAKYNTYLLAKHGVTVRGGEIAEDA